MLDEELATWSYAPKGRRDYVYYPAPLILKDVKNVLKGVADLPKMAEIDAPVSERHFVWLGLQKEALDDLELEEEAGVSDRKGIERDLEVTVDAVRHARNRFARVGRPAGVRADKLQLKGSAKSPVEFLESARRVLKHARRALPKFHSRRVAEELLVDLDEATEAFATVVDRFTAEQEARKDRTARSLALRAMTYETMTLICEWGRPAVGDHPTRKKVYRLANLFPKATDGFVEFEGEEDAVLDPVEAVIAESAVVDEDVDEDEEEEPEE